MFFLFLNTSLDHFVNVTVLERYKFIVFILYQFIMYQFIFERLYIFIEASTNFNIFS